MDILRLVIMMIIMISAASCTTTESNNETHKYFPHYTNHTLVKIHVKSDDDIQRIIKLDGMKREIRMLEDPSANLPIRILSSPEDTSFALHYLKNYSLEFEIITKNYQKEIDQYKMEGILHSSDPFERYLSYDEIRDLLNNLAKLPNISLTTIGHSVMGREISMLEINGHPRRKRFIVIECGIHSREWITHATCLNFARNMIKNPCKPMEEFSLFIIPMANPDGYVLTFEGNRLHRKNCGRPYPVDLNRNFDAGWESDNVSAETYPGPKPFSEPETRALKKMVESFGEDLNIYLSVHAFGQVWLTPYGYKNSPPKNASKYERINKIVEQTMSCQTSTCKRKEDSHFKFKAGPIATVVYEAHGSTVDWVHDTSNSGKKMSFAIELPGERDSKDGFLLPEKYIPAVNQSFTETICAVMEERIRLD